MSTSDFNQRHLLQDEKIHIEYLVKQEPQKANIFKPVLLYINKRISEITQKIS